MKAMFNYFVELDVLVKSPAARVKFLPANNEKMRVVSFETEEHQILAIRKLEEFTMVRLAAELTSSALVQLAVYQLQERSY